MTARPLRIVKDEPEPEDELAVLIPRLTKLEGDIAETRAAVAVERRRLATKRRVAFIREEHVRQEFGNP